MACGTPCRREIGFLRRLGHRGRRDVVKLASCAGSAAVVKWSVEHRVAVKNLLVRRVGLTRLTAYVS